MIFICSNPRKHKHACKKTLCPQVLCSCTCTYIQTCTSCIDSLINTCISMYMYMCIYMYMYIVPSSYLIKTCTCTCIYSVWCLVKEENKVKVKEGSKQGQADNNAKQHSTPKAITFPKKNTCKLGGTQTHDTLHSRQAAAFTS